MKMKMPEYHTYAHARDRALGWWCVYFLPFAWSLSTRFTIFCSSTRNARTILRVASAKRADRQTDTQKMTRCV